MSSPHCRQRSWTLPLAAALLLALAALLVPARTRAQQALAVTGTEFHLALSATTVTAGAPVTVTMANRGTVVHNLEVELEDQGIEQVLFDGNLQPGETRTASYTFSTPGEWTLYCPVGNHRAQGMTTTLTVLAPGQVPPQTGHPGSMASWARLALLTAALGALVLGAGIRLRRRA